MGKLTFKGDAPIKKKKKVKTSSSKHLEEEEEAIDGWLTIPQPSLAMGPLYLTLPTTALNPACCLALQPTTGKVFPFILPTPSSTASAEASGSGSNASRAAQALALGMDQEDIDALVDLPDEANEDPSASGPTDVHHVWVTTRIPDSDTKVTFRSAVGKYLAADEVGMVTADREARGAQEEWSIEPASNGSRNVRIRSSYGKLLSVDTVAGGRLELRADEEGEGGESEHWKVWMQGAFLGKAKKALQERSGIKTVQAAQDNGLVVVGDLGQAEIDNIKKFQGRGQGRVVKSEEDVRNLKRARKDGKLGEAMLERRVKLKSDRYC